jgi:hypothetical protein
LQGGLDLVTPALMVKPGQLLDCLNYEPDINGGYRRMGGIERVDGRPKPSEQSYWIAKVTLTGSVSAGREKRLIRLFPWAIIAAYCFFFIGLNPFTCKE